MLTIKDGVIQNITIKNVKFTADIVQPSGKNNVRTLIAMPNPIGITVHNTANTSPSATDTAHVNWLDSVEKSDASYISSHFYVDDDSITQTCPLNETTYHAGDGSGDGNRKTISIEICENGDHAKAENNAIQLIIALQATIPNLKIYKHQDWSGKYCPRVILDKPNGWQDFLNRIEKMKLESQPNTISEKMLPYYSALITGKAVATVNYMWAWINKVCPDHQVPYNILHLWLDEGAKENIRGDIAFCQSMKETNFFKFTGTAKKEWFNPAGLGVTGADNVGERFISWLHGIRAQIQHLKAGADKEALSEWCVDNRFDLVTRGSRPTWVSLGRTWAVPGYPTTYNSYEEAYANEMTYGQTIMKYYVDMCETEPIDLPNEADYEAIAKSQEKEIDALKDELKEERTENEVLYHSLENKKAESEELNGVISSNKIHIDRLNNEITRLDNTLLAKDNEIKKLKEEIHEKIEKTMSALEEIDHLKKSINDLLEENKELKNQIPNEKGITQAALKSVSFIEWLKAQFI